jgi:predicted Holliday junction resolvase-like endonuclease
MNGNGSAGAGNLETAFLVAFIIGAIAAMLITVLVYQFRLQRLRVLHERDLRESSKRSVNQSRSTLKGQMAEQMAPFLAGFEYLPADARFLGDPIDYVVFQGRTGLGERPENNDPLEIVLLEIKQGQSRLTRVQQEIARAVEEGRVRFEINRVGEDGRVTRSTWRRKG